MSAPVAVVAAIREELEPLARRLEGRALDRIGGLEVRRGALGGRPVVLAVTGEGRRAATALEPLLAAPGLVGVVGLGVAGGLTADLEAGDVVLGERIVDLEEGALEPPAWALSESARGAGALGGTLVTAPRIASTPAAKRELAARLGLEARSTVDLESAAWARAATARELPWLVLRSVSDPVDEALPLDFDRFRNADGELSRPRILAHALVRPRLMAELERLRRRVAACAQALATVAVELLAR